MGDKPDPLQKSEYQFKVQTSIKRGDMMVYPNMEESLAYKKAKPLFVQRRIAVCSF